MVRIFVSMLLAIFSVSSAAAETHWEKFFTPIDVGADSEINVAFEEPPEEPAVHPLGQSFWFDLAAMWTDGYAPIGYSSFVSRNGYTRDAIRLGRQLEADQILLSVNVASAHTYFVRRTFPTVTTSRTTGNFSRNGPGGPAFGRYSERTTTYGTESSYVPETSVTFNKVAFYFRKVKPAGDGLFSRPLQPGEIATIETQRATAILAVRRGSPAYLADILPGDILLRVNDKRTDARTFHREFEKGERLEIELFRNGEHRNLTMEPPFVWDL